MSHDGVFDSISNLAGRAALEVRPGGVLALGPATASYDPDDMTSLLTAHLTLVRKVRRQQREATILLRRDDVTALADLLGESTAEVIEKLGSLMGATRSQRTAMATLFAAGALVIGLASSGAVIGRGGPQLSGSAVGVRGPAAGAPVIEFAADPADQVIIDAIHATDAVEMASTGRPAAADFDVVLDLPATRPAAQAPIVASTPEAVPVPTVSPGTDAAPTAPSTTGDSAGRTLPSVPPPVVATPPMVDTDPALVDIGSPPIPVPPSTVTPAPEADPGAVAPPEIIEEPWLVVDPPAPGFEVPGS